MTGRRPCTRRADGAEPARACPSGAYLSGACPSGAARTGHPVADAPATHDATTLFCIPHAGGSAAYYARLGQCLPETVAFRPLELPGRGRRHREAPHTSMEALTHDLFRNIQPVAQTAPYALFGHSMGALLALLCAARARESGMPLPRALFISAASPPGCRERPPVPPVASLSPRKLWECVVGIGGVPQGIAASDEFRRYLEPVLRADFTALEAWLPAPMEPLPVPVTVFRGHRDLITDDMARQWQRLTTEELRVRIFQGNHFYLQDNWEGLASCIARACGAAAA